MLGIRLIKELTENCNKLPQLALPSHSPLKSPVEYKALHRLLASRMIIKSALLPCVLTTYVWNVDELSNKNLLISAAPSFTLHICATFERLENQQRRSVYVPP